MSVDQTEDAQARKSKGTNADITVDEAFWLTDLYPDASALFRHDITPLKDVSGECIVVLDGNILLWPYDYNTESLNALEAVYRKLATEKRLVVPGQAVREFYKHRSRKIGGISEKIIGAINKNKLQIFDKIALLENATDYQEARELAGQMVELGKQVGAKLDSINLRLKNEIGADPVSSMYREVLADAVVEIPMGDEDRKAILSDTKRRARYEIAPGFKDAKKADGGIGDLVIWKTVLQEAANRKCHALFVTDEAKPDWWVRANGAFHPRPELLEEYRQHTEDKSLHLLPLSSLLALFESPKDVVKQAVELEQARTATNALVPASPDSGKPCLYNGVELASRYDLATEIQGMKRIVDLMAPPLRDSVESIWCDSKASACYSVKVRRALWHGHFHDWACNAFMVNGGHNGVWIEGEQIDLHIPPNWKDF
jgi:hypothetical protein